ncbi:receptor-like protein EIX2 [Abrus precatorius]|uniref:Receptor-like protein EIX2 n=1 Tax=Abrus precatorius TaxID=3816 RepID=A0A8B8LMS6_ABRPR|nr:receptor-like protein EIX2 [Abrus precatorius]
MVCLVLQIVSAKQPIRCIQREREALLQFKSRLVDHSNMLSSWTTPDCCQWKGIRCSNLTAHVLMLDLHGDDYEEYHVLSGEVHKSLMELQQLQDLNLSWNYFQENHIPEFFSSLHNLRSLDLSYSRFGGKIRSQFGSLAHLKYLNLAGNHLEGSIPYEFGNLSMLQHLDLSGNPLEGNIPSQLGNLFNLQKLYLGRYGSALKTDDGNHGGGQWLSNLTSLTHLYLFSISNLHGSHYWLQMIGKLPKLRELSLSDCSLSDHFIHSMRPSQFNVSTSLSVLDLSENTFTSSIIFQWLSNITSNLSELDLRGNLLEAPPSNHFGMVMKSLHRVDLSYNRFKDEVLKSFMNICTLRSLYVYGNNFTEDLPSILHNLSIGCVRNSLEEIDLSYNKITGSLPHLLIFSSLKMLDLSRNQLSGRIPQGTTLPSQMQFLSLGSNSLEGGVPKSFGSTCTLNSLDLSYNSLSGEVTGIFSNFSGCSGYSLRDINLEGNEINGTISDLSMFSKFRSVMLSGNRLSVKIPKSSILSFDQLEKGNGVNSIQNAGTLQSLDLSNNSLSEELPMIIHHLSRYARYSLQELYLSMNQINGTLPNLRPLLPSLKGLDLSENRLNGTVPKDIQFPTELRNLLLNSNSMKGVITDSHFANMSKLELLDLSDNSLALAFTHNWVPQFQLSTIRLRSCELGPAFPKWLQTQNNYQTIDISDARISDIVPCWFWAKLASQEWMTMNISHNNLKGVVTKFRLKNPQYSLILASNQFEGPIPPFLRRSMFLDLSNNKFSSSLPFLCASGVAETLYSLDLSNNQLSGQIPDCWSHFKSLVYLDLNHNKFSGKIPTSMGSLHQLQALLLRNNNLTEEIPFSLRSCTKLVMIDVAENGLSGPIPTWIGSTLQVLQILILARNQFFGSLPLQICYLKSIQLLDLSLNNFSGQIPKCFQNFTLMARKTSSKNYPQHSYFVNTSYEEGDISYDLNAILMWKGAEEVFANYGLFLLKIIDLSCNNFSGEIPADIEDLFELISLNLSRNNLRGQIPSNIGKLASLEFLDLSRNQIVGSIPWSLTQIDRLSMLDLSHNHLSGAIPTGTQLQSFNASSYEDNFDLCGAPLEKLCIEGEPPQEPIQEKDDSLFNRGFYISMTFGFVIAFSGIFGSILINRSWRHAYFNFLNNLIDSVYVMVAIKLIKHRSWYRALLILQDLHPLAYPIFELVVLVEWSYNTSVHSSIGYSPFHIIYGKPAPSLPNYLLGSSSVEAVDTSLASHHSMLAQLQKKLLKAQATMKLCADAKCRDVTYEVGDLVYVRLRTYHSDAGITSLPTEAFNNQPIIRPLAILATRMDTSTSPPTKLVLVQWYGLSPDDTSWEEWEQLSSNYHLEDKVLFPDPGVGSNQTTPPLAKSRPKRITSTPAHLKDYTT